MGLSMSESNEVLKIIRYYAAKKKSPSLMYAPFETFVQNYAEKYKEKHPELKMFLENPATVLTAELESLASEKRIKLEYEDTLIHRVLYPDFFGDTLQDEYRRIEGNPEIPFPTEETLNLKIPQELLTVINVKSEFVDWLKEKEATPDTSIVLLTFPEGFNSMIIPGNVLKKNLLELSLGKIKVYMGTRRNANYIFNKLQGVLGKKDIVLKDTIDDIMVKTGKSLEQILKPTEFSFRFWTTLANLIIQEYRPKTNKLAEETSFCQASFLIGFYAVFHKGLIRKEKDSHEAFRYVEKSLKREPYFFSVSDIYNFKDPKGILLTKKVSREELNSYLERRTRPEQDKAIPEVLRLNTPEKKQYYIHKDAVLPLCVKKIFKASSAYRQSFVDEWAEQMKDLKSSSVMNDDDRFLKTLEDRLKQEDPLLHVLLNYELLYLTKDEVTLSKQVEFNINRLFDVNQKSLIPLDEILKLDRNELLTDARRRLPMWQVMPVFGPLFVLVKRLLRGSGKKKGKEREQSSKRGFISTAPSYKPRAGFKKVSTQEAREKPSAPAGDAPSSGQTAKAKMVVFRKHIAALTLEFVGPDGSLDKSMKELTTRWNPLFDEKARKDLIEDVNSMIRDFIRGLKRGILIKPPDANGIRSMAERLAGNKAFEKIKHKDEFKQYIELYMLKILGRS